MRNFPRMPMDSARKLFPSSNNKERNDAEWVFPSLQPSCHDPMRKADDYLELRWAFEWLETLTDGFEKLPSSCFSARDLATSTPRLFPFTLLRK